MRKLKVVLCSALFSAAALSSVSAAWAEGEQSAETAPEVQAPAVQAPAVQTPESQNSLSQDPQEVRQHTNPNDPYDLQYFFADFKRFAIGDVVPELYRSKKYEIVQWKLRHLPAPEADSHWTYMGGNYVLITNAEGKILQAKQGDIYYKR
ncbi:RcnB family protein [Erwinia sorbitola]|uniref:Nickel/cobalt homeostasis protein RcnB n=1 Tax=Erwinia sorbitola TaxID=2681984 RepID=A0A6I6E9V8_9GAMM|nr:RcnB family protein [Erwinia sorbitola]QGU86527.1 hypothetical protein GN242_04495 [Erwinia sorbitola]